MGYDLKPVKLRNQWGDGEPIWQRYNMAGWRELNKLIQEFKLRPLPQTNDGNLIVEKKCLAIAKIIFEMPEFSFSENGIKDAFLEAVMSENVEVVKILIEKR